MDLALTDDQQGLRASIREVLVKECPPTLVREVVEKGVGRDALWQTVVQLGWPALTVPEDAGGIGFGPVELALLAEELGRACAPGPLLTTISQYLPAVGADRAADVAVGTVTGTLAARPTTNVRAEDGRLTGEATVVMDAVHVDRIVVEAASADGPRLFDAALADADVVPRASLDPGRPVATVHFDTTPAEPLDADPTPVVATATLALSAETVGVCQAMLDLTVAHTSAREQFGVPVGSFQSVKHQLADVHVLVEKARATTWFAALTLAEGDDRWPLAVGMAKAAASEAANEAARAGIQLHGGIGFTWEHDLQLWAKRARANALLFGTTAESHRSVADALGV